MNISTGIYTVIPPHLLPRTNRDIIGIRLCSVLMFCQMLPQIFISDGKNLFVLCRQWENVVLNQQSKGVRTFLCYCCCCCCYCGWRVQAENLMFRAGKLIVKTLIRNMKKKRNERKKKKTKLKCLTRNNLSHHSIASGFQNNEHFIIE